MGGFLSENASAIFFFFFFLRSGSLGCAIDRAALITTPACPNALPRSRIRRRVYLETRMFLREKSNTALVACGVCLFLFVTVWLTRRGSVKSPAGEVPVVDDAGDAGAADGQVDGEANDQVRPVLCVRLWWRCELFAATV